MVLWKSKLMRRKQTHLRDAVLGSQHPNWARLLTAILILATTAANVGAIGLLHLCPVRGVAEQDECCCAVAESQTEARSFNADSCEDGQIGVETNLGCCGSAGIDTATSSPSSDYGKTDDADLSAETDL